MKSSSFSLQQLSEITSAKLVGNPLQIISGVNTLEAANANEASFLANPRYIEAMKLSSAGVICIDSHQEIVEGKNFLISDDPSRTFQCIAEFLNASQTCTGFGGIHPSAVIHQSAEIEKNVQIGPNVTIDQGVKIGDGTVIYPNVSIGPKAIIGKDCILHPCSVVREGCILGDRVILQPGAVIGSCGFGYLPDKQGRFTKLEQIGIVILEDDVEIGANTTIDRARFKTTKISQGTKIDNLVQIAHNVEIGPHNAIAAQTGIAGSSKTGRNVIMGGQVGITGHVEITDGCMLATRTGVSKSLLTPGKYRGSPALPLDRFNRQEVQVRRLDKYIKMIEELQTKVKDLEAKIQALQA